MNFEKPKKLNNLKVLAKEEAIPVQRFTEVFLKRKLFWALVSFSVERLTAEWDVVDSIPGA